MITASLPPLPSPCPSPPPPPPPPPPPTPPCLVSLVTTLQLPYESILVVAQAHSLLTQAFDAVDVVVKAGGHSSVEQGSSAAVS